MLRSSEGTNGGVKEDEGREARILSGVSKDMVVLERVLSARGCGREARKANLGSSA